MVDKSRVAGKIGYGLVGATSGAAVGACLGSVVPGIGTAIGAGIGAVGGFCASFCFATGPINAFGVGGVGGLLTMGAVAVGAEIVAAAATATAASAIKAVGGIAGGLIGASFIKGAFFDNKSAPPVQQLDDKIELENYTGDKENIRNLSNHVLQTDDITRDNFSEQLTRKIKSTLAINDLTEAQQKQVDVAKQALQGSGTELTLNRDTFDTAFEARFKQQAPPVVEKGWLQRMRDTASLSEPSAVKY